MTQLRGPHIVCAIFTAALVSLPLDAMVMSAVLTDIRMAQAARSAEEREARRERDRAFADTTCVLSLGCAHGPERRGDQGVTLGRDRGFEQRYPVPVLTKGYPPRSLYTVTAYSHRCALPRDGRERAPRPAANGEWPVPGLTLAADWTLHPPGSVLIVGGRRWRVTDRGHDIRGRRLDLFLGTCAEARIYGRRVVPVEVEAND